METLVTERLLLEPISVPMIEAVARGDWAALEQLANARGPMIRPGPELIHRGFGWSIERIRRNPEWRLWGDRSSRLYRSEVTTISGVGLRAEVVR